MKRLLFLSGSLRRNASSAALARALAERVAGDAATATFDIGSLAHYDADLDPAGPVAAFKDAIAAADGLVIVTPEYNYSIPGVLKNAIDWASRPAYRSVLRDKPVLVISVSGGALGGVRAQAHLKYVLNGVLAKVLPWQEIVVPHAPAKVRDGRFTDEAVLDFAVAGVHGLLAAC